MDAEQVLAFRFARSGLATRTAESLTDAVACPASDFSHHAALLALAARRDGVTRQTYAEATDSGELVLAHVVRGAIHALAPHDRVLYGPALISDNDWELGVQLGQQMQRLVAERGFAFSDALDAVAEATREALKAESALAKNELHQELRERVSPELSPWCEGCGSHHVAPMLWRYATSKAGVRLDSKRRYVLAEPARPARACEAVRRFLYFYGPATVGDFTDWTGVAKSHAERLWKQLEADLTPASVGKGKAWLMSEDAAALASPPAARGIRLIPPGDPYLQKPNRPLLAPDSALRKRLFRPPASPGGVLKDGNLVGLWRVRSKGKQAEITVEKLGRFARRDVEEEAQRIADLRNASGLVLAID